MCWTENFVKEVDERSEKLTSREYWTEYWWWWEGTWKTERLDAGQRVTVTERLRVLKVH